MSHKRSTRRTSAGFTLMELMVAITILAVLAVLIARAVRGGVQSKVKIEKTISQETQINDVLRMIEADLKKAFHHQSIDYQLRLAQYQSEMNPSATPSASPSASPTPQSTPTLRQPGQPGAAVIPPPTPPPQTTGFVGRTEEIHFTTLNHHRTIMNSKESDQAEVGYFLRECKSPRSPQGSNCLWRRFSPYLDDETDKGGTETALIENVQNLSFRYFTPQKTDWVTEWHSRESRDGAIQNHFPSAVEVKIALNRAGEESRSNDRATIERTIVVPIRFPNNPKPTNQQRMGSNDQLGEF